MALEQDSRCSYKDEAKFKVVEYTILVVYGVYYILRICYISNVILMLKPSLVIGLINRQNTFKLNFYC